MSDRTGKSLKGSGSAIKYRHRAEKWCLVFAFAIMIGVIIASDRRPSVDSTLHETRETEIPSCATTTRGVISIQSDGEFTLANGVVGGSGTSNDPYIIAGWDIDADGKEFCISIMGTSRVYIIANCTLRNALTSTFGRGIQINSAKNATIKSNVIINCIDGIHVGYSNATILNNTCVGNSQSGIHVEVSSKITITNNTCRNNQYGIYCFSCDQATVTENYCAYNRNEIYLTGCTGCTITANIIEYYFGILYWGTTIQDVSGIGNDTANNLIIPLPGPLDIWMYILIIFIVAAFCGVFLRNKIHATKEHRQATPARWQSPWRARAGIIVIELCMVFALPGMYKIESGAYTAEIIASLYNISPIPTIGSDMMFIMHFLFLIPAGGVGVHLLFEISTYRKARAALKATLPKQCQESWEVKDLVKGITRRCGVGFAISLGCAIFFAFLGFSMPGIGVPASALFLLPAWVLYRQLKQEGDATFKGECVAIFKSNPERAFAASLDQEFEAWASGTPESKVKGGKVEALPHEIGRIPPPLIEKSAQKAPPADLTPVLLQILLQIDAPNKNATIEAYKKAIVDAFGLSISPADLSGLKGEELATRLVKALQEASS